VSAPLLSPAPPNSRSAQSGQKKRELGSVGRVDAVDIDTYNGGCVVVERPVTLPGRLLAETVTMKWTALTVTSLAIEDIDDGAA